MLYDYISEAEIFFVGLLRLIWVKIREFIWSLIGNLEESKYVEFEKIVNFDILIDFEDLIKSFIAVGYEYIHIYIQFFIEEIRALFCFTLLLSVSFPGFCY